MQHATKEVPGAPRDHRIHEREAERAFGRHEAKGKIDDRSAELFREVRVLGDRILGGGEGAEMEETLKERS